MMKLKIQKYLYHLLTDLFPYSVDLPYAHDILKGHLDSHGFYIFL